MSNIWKTKSIESLINDSKGTHSLNKSLSAFSLIAIGVGAIVGAGIFSITGEVAGTYTGPALVYSFIIAGIGALFTGLCYCEFATMLPVSGSAYSYAYATLGEFIAWIIGWDLILEYTLASSFISVGWSQYFQELLDHFNLSLPIFLSKSFIDGGFVDLPALLIVIVLSFLLIKGIKESALVNNILVIVKLIVIITFIIIGWKYMDPANHLEFIPKYDQETGHYGIPGIFKGASIVFIAFIGFDAISTSAQEVKNPNRDLPIGIIGALVICTLLYALFSYVMTGLVYYKEFIGDARPAATAFAKTGFTSLNLVLIIAILTGLTSGILVMLMGQSRIFYNMSKDGLLPRFFGDVHHKYRTPWKSNLTFMVFVSLFAGFVPIKELAKLISLGTLIAFSIVCIGIIVLRIKKPNINRPFKAPLFPIVPILGAGSCIYFITKISPITFGIVLGWILIGIIIYFWYGRRNSKINDKTCEN